MNKIVEVQNVTKVYGKNNEKKTQALSGISFDVEKGEFIGIMGASGSGKSTLLNILSTLDKPTDGHIRINQKDVTTLKGNQLADFRANEIGFIFQDFNLLESLTAQENIAVPLSLQGVRPKEIKQRVQKIAERLSISHILESYPSEISGGQKQRVALARALAMKPDLLDTMDELNTKDHVSILLVTHDPFSASYCQRILFIKDGGIHQEVKRGDQSRDSFYREILSILGNLEQ